MTFPQRDLDQLQRLAIDPEQAALQLERLHSGQAWTRLERPCVPGDGILQSVAEPSAASRERLGDALAAGRVTRFVPASGAASRMFKPLYADPEVFEACRAPVATPGASSAEAELRRYLDNLEQFAFCPELAQALAGDGLELARLIEGRRLEPLIRYLLEPCGLDYAALPKGLLGFHATPAGPRTPFEEHLAEAALLMDRQAPAVAHFTVSPAHRPLFEARFATVQAALETQYGCALQVSYSVQKPSTDTLALDANGQPLREASGALVLRPGGHGALIENLNDLQGDLVLIRNIDNVVPDRRKTVNLDCSRRLLGLLLELQQEQHLLLKALHETDPDPMVCELTLAFLNDRLQSPTPPTLDPAVLIERLDRPIRICGMVPNSGEPGGGPFWVRSASGELSRQIVEGAQIDKADPAQAAILAGSTHFNPVDMVCGVRDWLGRPYDLRRFVDDEAVIITGKSQAGEEIRVLELPGLWNGGMAGWHTLFLEIPEAAFNPVKTVFDLLRPAHQP